MVSICKIVKNVFGGIVVSLSLQCTGQNIYNSRTVYYNMDTTRCIDNDTRFWEWGEINPNSGNPDSSGLYCTEKETVTVPFVTVNDDKIVRLIDSCQVDAAKSDCLLFPDTSGYFVELHFFENTDDTLSLGMVITPYSNYYMADILSSFRNDVFWKWYGHKEKELFGCFFQNNILCVITYQGWLDKDRFSRLFSTTESKIKLVLFSPIVVKVSSQIQSKCYYWDCD